MARSDQQTEPKIAFADYLTRHGLRLTGPRRTIVEVIQNTHEHFTAEQLLDWVRQRNRSISRATVYRTLRLLVRCGLLRELEIGKESRIYDPNYTRWPGHSHIVCEDCGRVVEFECAELQTIEQEVRRRLGFQAKSIVLQITCTCEEFRRVGACTYDPNSGEPPPPGCRYARESQENPRSSHGTSTS